MDPVTLGVVSAGASIIGTGVSALGAISAGQAQAAEARYQSQVAANNQIIANQNAAYATQAGEAKAYDQGLQERQRGAAIRATLASSGVDVNTGSAADIRESAAEVGETNVERVRSNAALQAYGYRTRATDFGAQATLDRAKAGFDETAGFLKAGGTLLSGAGAVGTKWMGLFNSANDTVDANGNPLAA